jgi:2-succinyl-6-hydroxy-2,4-cyclohexadiene-1-carboxylate synthase
MAPTLVLLHGFTHTGASWSPVSSELGERYTALAPDIRGHGSASDHEPVTLEAVIGDLELASPARFTLAGYSMGGRIAVHFALARPTRVEQLILIGASPGIADPAERDERRRGDDGLADGIERSEIAEFAARWESIQVLAGQPPNVLAAVRADRLRNTPAGLARALRGLGTGALPSTWDRLPELAMPVTLVVGERDRKFSKIAVEMAASIPDATVEVVSGAGHAVHLEAPARVAAVIAGR